MSDNTTLNSGSGGDVIRTDELIDEATGLATAKVQAVKLLLGGKGADGGVVTRNNPLPVADRTVSQKLDCMIELLERIAEALE